MKLSLRGILTVSLGAVALSLPLLAISAAHADEQEIDLNSDRVQIVHSGGSNRDSTNFNITFTNYGEGDCDGGEDDAIASGIEVALTPGSCFVVCDAAGGACVASKSAPVIAPPFDYYIAPFVAHTVNHETYGTFFGQNPVDVGPGTVSARIVLLSVPPNGCGTWNLNVEATGLNLSSITSNPMSLWLNDSDLSGPFCFDIDNAIIGNPIPRPGVRRGVRRSR
jgi:hypothetical protein